MTPSKIFLYFCLAFVAGVFLDSVFKIPQLAILSGSIFGFILICVFWLKSHRLASGPERETTLAENKKIVIFGFCILFAVLGIWRHGVIKAGTTNSQLGKFNDSGGNVILTGVVSQEPDIRANSIRLTINANQLVVGKKVLAVSGKVLVTTDRYPEYQYGQELQLTGKLKTPADDLEGFNYKDYLSKDGIYSQMSWPKINLIASGKGNTVYSAILAFKEKLRTAIYQNLSPPQSSILGAVILGDKRQLSDDLKNALNTAGVRHITAISGMHITIIAGILMALAIGLGLSRGKAFYFALGVLFLYIIMVGAPASAIRAGIMGGLLMLGQKMGRLSVSSRAIVFVAALMLFQNPLILKLDIGFQLSFLAVMGIIYLMPFFQRLLARLPNFKFFALRDMLSMTFAAQIFTLPILIYNFGYFSVVSPAANIFIVPLLPLVMIAGFVFGLVAIVLPALGWVLSWGSWLLLTYVLKVVEFFSNLPMASLNVKLNLFWVIAIYIFLAIFIWRLRQREKFKFLDY